MKIDIWSDIVCPFCYIGKRRLEQALAGFAHRADVQVTWKSYELHPDFAPVPGESIHTYLAKRKGISEAEARRLNDHLTATAAGAGLTYRFDEAVPANTFRAHQLVQYAATQGRQAAAEERLMDAYYREGRDLNDLATLVALAGEVGLDPEATRAALLAGTYAPAVRRDEREAQQLGVQGVPFFVFDDKYAVSGAQPAEVFSQVLDQVWAEEHSHPTPAVLAAGDACDLEAGNC